MGSKSLGTLTIDLVAQVGGFVSGMDKAERQSAKWRKQVKQDLDVAGKALAGLAIAGGTALGAIAVSTVRSANEITKFSSVANASTTEFQRFAAGARAVGIEQGKLADILKDVNDRVGDFVQTGGGPMADFFEKVAPKVGVTADQFRALSGPEALGLYVSTLEKAGVNQQDMTFYMEAMASDATALLPLLQNNAAGMKAFGDEAERAGAILGQETLAKAQELNAAMFVMESASAGLKNQLGAALVPVLSDFAIGLSDVTVDGTLAAEMADTLAKGLKTIAAGAVGAYASVQMLGKALGGGLATLDTANSNMSAWEKFSPIMWLKELAFGNEVQQTADVVAEDLEQTAERFAGILNKIWNAGGEGGTSGSDTENRIKKLAEFYKRVASEARSALGGVSDSKTADTIKNQIEALELQAETIGKSASAVTLYKLQNDGATESDLKRAEAALAVVDAYKKQEEVNKEAVSIAESLFSDEEAILASYERRRQIILDNTRVTGEAQKELLRKLEEQKNEELIELNGSYWEQYLAAAEENLTSFDELAGNMLENFTGRFGDAFESMVFDSESLGEAFTNLAQGMARSVVNALGQMAAQWLAYQAVQLVTGKAAQATQAAAMINEAAAMQQMAGLNAFAATAAIPVVGPAAAPGAALEAVGATEPYVAAVAGLSLAGMAHDGIDSIPEDGTWFLKKKERVTTAETSAKLDRTLDQIQRNQGSGLSTSGVVVNLIEDASRAGQVEQRHGPDGEQEIDVFVADIRTGGPRARVLEQTYPGLKRSGY